MKKFRFILPLALLLGLLIGCGPATSGGPVTLKLVTHDSFDIGEETLAEFEAMSGHTVEIVKSGDAGEMVNRSILSANNPLGDVIFGIDNTFLSRALDADILTPYRSPVLGEIDQSLRLDETNRALPVDKGDVCLNYDLEYFAASDLDAPSSLDDLIDPAYAGLTVVQNPATSSPGLAFLMATIATYGEDGYLDYWTALADNDLLVESGWSEAYYGAFTRYGGDRPIVVSYASSPPAEVLFADPPIDDAVTASVTVANSCFRQVEFIGILDGSENELAARELVDFMLGTTFQEDMPLRMFVFPANNSAELPDSFTQYAEVPDQPATLDPERIATNRDQWIEAWTDVVLR